MPVRVRVSLFALAAAAVLGLPAAGLAGDTLFTTFVPHYAGRCGLHCEPPVGDSDCEDGSHDDQHVRDVDSDAPGRAEHAKAVAGTLTSGTFTTCAISAAGDFPWRFTVRGTGVASGANTVFTNTTWDDVSATLWGVSPGNGRLTDATGTAPPTNGVYARQTTATGSSICFVLNNAGTLSGPLLTDGKIDATYCVEGGVATTWSFGTPPPPPPTSFLHIDPAGTTPVPALVANQSGTATLQFAGPQVTCASAIFSAGFGASGGVTIAGGLSGLTLSSCTDTLGSRNIKSCARFAATGSQSLTLRATGSGGGTVQLGGTSLRCAPAGTSTGCYYDHPHGGHGHRAQRRVGDDVRQPSVHPQRSARRYRRRWQRRVQRQRRVSRRDAVEPDYYWHGNSGDSVDLLAALTAPSHPGTTRRSARAARR